MRLVSTCAVPDGSRLGRDLPAPPGGAPLLRAGAVIADSEREFLFHKGVSQVYVEDEIGAGIEIPEPLSEGTRRQARAAVSRAFRDATRMPGTLLPHDCLDELTAAARTIVDEIGAVGDRAFAFPDLAGPEDYNLEHSIDATVVGLLVGRRLIDSDELVELGTGLFIQDIGKLALPPHLVHKPGPLAPAERELMMQHPLLGLEFLRDDDLGFGPRSVVRSHHERWDGSGYPNGISREQISPLARIAAAADVFDAVTSERWYATAEPQAVGVETIRAGAGTAFDPEVADAFCDVIAPHPAGSEIELADGRRGVVVSVPDDAVRAPLVRMLDSGEEIDLAREPALPVQPIRSSAAPTTVSASIS